MGRCRLLLLTFPAQGHINPSIQLAKHLVKMGVEVILVTSLSAVRRMSKPTVGAPTDTTNGLTFVSFSDGYDDGYKPTDDVRRFSEELRSRGSQCLREIIVASREEGRPISTLVYTSFLPWAALVARELHVPSTLLWIQPANVFDIYYYYCNGYGESIRENHHDPSWSITLPIQGLPSLGSQDFPTFLIPSSSDNLELAIKNMKEQLAILDEETRPQILINTFDSLEVEALKAIDKYKLVGVGPLIPLAFLDGEDPSDTSFGCDLYKPSSEHNYMEWLNSKPESSVVYISFGTLLALPKQQMEEVAKGVLGSGRPFLWVMREKRGNSGEEDDNKISCLEELKEQGMIVQWCSQLEVLSHPSIGCFVSHGGWNSTMESLALGVPNVAFPHWSDQKTNAKLIEDVWKIGVRVGPNEEGVVESDEIKRCIELVMVGGDRGDEIRRNAKIWKDLAREAVKEGGSSYQNLRAFASGIQKKDCS